MVVSANRFQLPNMYKHDGANHCVDKFIIVLIIKFYFSELYTPNMKMEIE